MSSVFLHFYSILLIVCLYYSFGLHNFCTADVFKCFFAIQALQRSLPNPLRQPVAGRIEAFRETLVRAEREAEENAKQARVLKSAGVLIGTGLAILLL